MKELPHGEHFLVTGLVRYSVFFVMELESRRVEIAGISNQPCAAWMQQVGRDLVGWDGFLEGKRF